MGWDESSPKVGLGETIDHELRLLNEGKGLTCDGGVGVAFQSISQERLSRNPLQ